MVDNKKLGVGKLVFSTIALMTVFDSKAMLATMHRGIGNAQFSSVAKQFVMKDTNIGITKFLSRTLQGSKLGPVGLGLSAIGVSSVVYHKALDIEKIEESSGNGSHNQTKTKGNSNGSKFSKEYTYFATGISIIGYSYYSYDDTNQKGDHIKKTKSTSNRMSYIAGGVLGLLSAGYIYQYYCHAINKSFDPQWFKRMSYAMDSFDSSLALSSLALLFKQIINIKDRRNQILKELNQRISHPRLPEEKKDKLKNIRESIQDASDHLSDSFKLATVLGSIANSILRNECSTFPAMVSISGAGWYPLQEITKLNAHIKSAVRLINDDTVSEE